MEDGFYWIRRWGVVEEEVGELDNGRWYFTAMEQSYTHSEIEVLSPRLSPPSTTQYQP